ncbi:hypothetical protein FOZ62_009476, partial [Perkinsus olseni]
MSSSSSSSQSPTRRATGSGADRSASAPPSSGAARDDSHRRPTASSSLPSRRHMRSESAIEPTQAALPAESSPGGRRPWHRRAREISAAAAARQALAESEGQRQIEPRPPEQPREGLPQQPSLYGEEQEERLRYYATSGQEVPPTVAMTARPEIEAPRVERAPPSSSSVAESSRPRLEPHRAQPGRAQPRVQVARLREGVLRVLRERGYVPTADPDGGVSKMTPEQIEQYIPHGASLGSLLHGREEEEEQECAPCLFHAKRRCLRGAKCLFCHEDGHE